jgi:hypothetical protein
MDIVLFGIRDMGNWDGRYNVDKVNPFFQKLSYDSAYALYREMYGTRVLSMTNGVFFEAPTESLYTQLSYPLEYEGILISSGGSPNGPPSENYPLLGLGVGDSSAEVVAYDPSQSSRSGHSRFQNQIVTLNYRNHPNVREFPQRTGGYKSRYHLIAATSRDQECRKQTIVVLTSNYETSILALARELRNVCRSISDQEILTLDGGSSISLVDRDGKAIIRPEEGVRVPVFLGFRLKGGEPSGVLRIKNPGEAAYVNCARRYFIFCDTNDEVVDLELYQGNRFVTTLHGPAFRRHRGLFVWDPDRCPPGEGYQLTLRSSSGKETRSGCFTVVK